MLQQEILFKTYNNTDLKYYRENLLQVNNKTWCSSVTGFLFDEIELSLV